jgi:hypothetical protein
LDVWVRRIAKLCDKTLQNKGLLKDRRSAEKIQKSQRSAGFELLISGSQVRALVRPPSPKAFSFNKLPERLPRTKRVSCDVFVVARRTADCCATFPLFLYLHPVRYCPQINASIMPRLVSGNTNAPTMMIGERARFILGKEAAA